jgi:hypothetical protein
MSVTILWLLACASEEPGGYGLRDSAGGDDGPVPAIDITAPAYGAGFYDGVGELTWTVTNFTLDAAAVGGAAREGAGHVHVYVDEERVGDVADTRWEITGLPSGTHKLRVALADNDHSEFGVDSTVDIAAASPAIRILTPAEASRYDRSAARMSFEVRDFTMVDPDPAAGAAFARGYVLLTVDGAPVDWTTDATGAIVTRLLPGEHVLGAELRNRDGTELPTPATDAVRVLVDPTAVGVAIDGSPFPTTGTWNSPAASLAIATSNFPLGGSNAYHVYVDGDFYQGDTRAVATVSNLSPGPHVLEVRLTSGGSENGAYDRVRLHVAEGRPNISVTRPGARWRVHPDFVFTLQPENFRLSPPGSTAGDGFYTIAMDGVEVNRGSSESIAMTAVPVGLHTFRIELVSPDGTPFTPPVFSDIDLNVQEATTSTP